MGLLYLYLLLAPSLTSGVLTAAQNQSDCLKPQQDTEVHHFAYYMFQSGPVSVVGIATGYGLDRPGIESRWGAEISRTCPDRPWGPSSLLYNGYLVFPGGKERPEA